jgi:hypothetical protein
MQTQQCHSLPENDECVQPVTFHSEQSSNFKSQGGTYFNMPERKFQS